MNSTVNTHTRNLNQVFTARDSHDGNGVKLQRVFSFQANPDGNSLDPFLLLDEFSSDDAADYIGGFPDHPHRGFETVTYMLAGRMEHRDHMGHRGQLVPGSVQWMTAASGIIHSEMPLQEEGLMQGFQLWINLPATEKMNAPAYQEYRPEEIPVYHLDNGATVKAIAGNTHIDGIAIKGAVTGISTAPTYLDITLPPDSRLTIPVDEAHTVLTYVYEGTVRSDPRNGETQRQLNAGQLGQWQQGEQLQICADSSGVRLLLLTARPLKEPVVQYGPFVMNTQEEIEQALVDYRKGQLTQHREQ